MRPRPLATCALLTAVGWGCAAEPTSHVDAQPSASPADLGPLVIESPGPCDRLPATGPCALACDLEQLRDEHVPEGVCIAFDCRFVDGEPFTLHVCNPL